MKRTLWTLCVATLTLWAGTAEVRSIVEKFEKVRRWRLDPDPGFAVYDPFRRAEPLVRKAAVPPPAPRPVEIRVEAILNDRAFVNGRWVQKGAAVGPWRVVAVKEEGVVVEARGKTLFVPLRRRGTLLKIKETEQ